MYDHAVISEAFLPVVSFEFGVHVLFLWIPDTEIGDQRPIVRDIKHAHDVPRLKD
jgi:hypothetical protein